MSDSGWRLAWLASDSLPDPRAAHLLLYVGLLLVASQIAGRLAASLRLPRVTGYLVAGVALGPSVSGLLGRRLVQHDLALIPELALAVIAFSIGGSLDYGRLRRLGATIGWTTCGQALGALLLVTAALLFALPTAVTASTRTTLAVSLVLGAVSTATAPAAVLAIVRQYRARGPLTTTLLGVVALDDGLAIVLFALAMAAARGLIGDPATAGGGAALLAAMLHIGAAVIVGGAAGLLLRLANGFFARRETLLGVVLGIVLVTSGLAAALGGSPLLAAMVLGAVTVNVVGQTPFAVVDRVEEPLFGLFFALAGAHLDVGLLATSIWLVTVLTLARLAGKMAGSAAGARISGADPVVGRYLGLALAPQAGVTVGLVLEARRQLPLGPTFEIAVNALLATVVINELIAPLLLRLALQRAGEVRSDDRQA